MTGVLMKDPETDRSDKFQFVRDAQTNGNDRGIDNAQIVRQLHEWDRRYRLNLIGAVQRQVIVEFERVPEDMDTFMKEVLAICPSQEYEFQAKRVAENLLKTKQIILWWD